MRKLIQSMAALLAAGAFATCAGAAGAAQDIPCAAPRPTLPARGFSQAVTRNTPAVVTVIVIRTRRTPGAEPEGAPFFQSMSGASAQDAARAASESRPERSFASGFFLTREGHVLTSAHAVHDALDVWVELADGRRLHASVLGFDLRNDVGLLQADIQGATPVQVAPDEPLCAGDWVAALGSPFGFEHTVSVGVVSMYPRLLPGGNGVPLIQTDVALNPGSSGGPLFNADGKVVGMNSMIYSDTGIYMGVSFAIPIDRVLRIASQLRVSGSARSPDLGMVTQPMNAELALAFGLTAPHGPLVATVKPGGPADQAGVRSGDIVLSVNGRPSQPQAELEEQIGPVRPGDWVTLDVWRQRASRRLRLRVNTGAQTPGEPAAHAGHNESRLGLTLAPAHKAAQPAGVLVESADGASLLAGIEEGDQITAINAIAVSDPAGFDAALAQAGDSAVVALLVTRGGVAMYIPVRRIGR